MSWFDSLKSIISGRTAASSGDPNDGNNDKKPPAGAAAALFAREPSAPSKEESRARLMMRIGEKNIEIMRLQKDVDTLRQRALALKKEGKVEKAKEVLATMTRRDKALRQATSMRDQFVRQHDELQRAGSVKDDFEAMSSAAKTTSGLIKAVDLEEATAVQAEMQMQTEELNSIQDVLAGTGSGFNDILEDEEAERLLAELDDEVEPVPQQQQQQQHLPEPPRADPVPVATTAKQQQESTVLVLGM